MFKIKSNTNVTNEFENLKCLYSNMHETNITHNSELKALNNIKSSRIKKIESQILQLNSLKHYKSKRGVTDGLESIIKSITGNLEQNYVIKYDEAISLLTNNQNNFRDIIKDQVTLVEYPIKKFQNESMSITENQSLLKNRIPSKEQTNKT